MEKENSVFKPIEGTDVNCRVEIVPLSTFSFLRCLNIVISEFGSTRRFLFALNKYWLDVFVFLYD